MHKLVSSLDIEILKLYAIWTTLLFVLLGLYYMVALPPEGFFRSVHIANIQVYSIMLFTLVLISSMAGMAFHHLISSEDRSRNTFALVFSVSTLKFLFGMMIFDMYIW